MRLEIAESAESAERRKSVEETTSAESTQTAESGDSANSGEGANSAESAENGRASYLAAYLQHSSHGHLRVRLILQVRDLFAFEVIARGPDKVGHCARTEQ
jgi:hypothetical protein